MPEDREHTTVEQAGSEGGDGAVDGGANPVTPARGGGQAGSQGVQPVPAPGHGDSSAGAGVRTAQGASPDDGIVQDDRSPGSDASVTSPGAWTAIAAPGAPDGEVDTRP